MTGRDRGEQPVDVAGTTNGLMIAQQGAAAIITLDRPQSLNALTIEMRRVLAEAFPRFARDPVTYAVILRSAIARAFSAGGDVREITSLARRSIADARSALADEFRLCWLRECFSKPTVSLIDGTVMGTGVGISLYGTHRVAGANYRFAMPETGIGFFPDCGMAHVFARMPDRIGRYLALTGRAIERPDAFFLGLATHCIAAPRFGEIVAQLADAEPIDPVLDSRHEDPGASQLTVQSGMINDLFAGETVEDIIAQLRTVRGTAQTFAEGVLADLARRSPLALKVTDRHLLQAAGLDLRATLEADYRLGCRFLEDHDFHEGARAFLVDKDRQPRWRPARLEDVTESMIARYFAPLQDGALQLPTRAQMQAARV